LTAAECGFIVNAIQLDGGRVFSPTMSSFGEDLRMERMARGMSLEEITAVTKISQRHLVALEEGNFRLLPGGIFSKGIVRSYTDALGLDQEAWTERFLKAYEASGQMPAGDDDWTEFARNVGKARKQTANVWTTGLRLVGVILLVLVVAAVVCLAVRFYGVRSGWWPAVLPTGRF
jgi:cytoskeletal protein RodZ